MYQSGVVLPLKTSTFFQAVFESAQNLTGQLLEPQPLLAISRRHPRRLNGEPQDLGVSS
jgi:hypothetical protein